jgi:hypothetical protein
VTGYLLDDVIVIKINGDRHFKDQKLAYASITVSVE